MLRELIVIYTLKFGNGRFVEIYKTSFRALDNTGTYTNLHIYTYNIARTRGVKYTIYSGDGNQFPCILIYKYNLF